MGSSVVVSIRDRGRVVWLCQPPRTGPRTGTAVTCGPTRSGAAVGVGQPAGTVPLPYPNLSTCTPLPLTTRLPYTVFHGNGIFPLGALAPLAAAPKR